MSNCTVGRQLAVVQGLVTDQVQRNKHGGRAVLKSRTSPANYGVLCQKLYDEVEHIGLKDIEIDELDGKRYITNLIHWFVKRVSVNILMIESD